MTLREFGHSIVAYWDRYWTEVTTQNVLDWSIGNLVITFVGGFIAATIGMAIIGGLFTVVWLWIEGLYKKTGLPGMMDRMDKRFGPFLAGVIVVVGVVGFFVALGVVFALVEMAQS